MKIGIIGTGAVGSACIMATIMRDFVHEIVAIDKRSNCAKAVVTDMRYGGPLFSNVLIHDGDYSDLKDANLIMITAGVNEKTGGATDRSDPRGRLKLLAVNANIYKEIIPQVVAVAPHAVILVVTDPPDPLAALVRHLVGHDRVLSAGTFLDTLRFCWHIGHYLNINPLYVEAQVIGEHGTSAVFLWSSATVGGKLLTDFCKQSGRPLDEFKQKIEEEVKFANITIIEGNNASQFGIGMVSARIAQMVLQDENALIPIGSYQSKYKTTLSLPSVVGSKGAKEVIEPSMSDEEQQALQRCAETLKEVYLSLIK